MKVFREFRFEAAHRLPDAPPGHKCRRLHGHSYRLIVYVQGKLRDEAGGTGWVVDFAEIRAVVDPLIERLDHRYLNEVDGLCPPSPQPTVEIVTRWIWRQLKPALPGLCKLELYETAKCGCVYEGEDE
jgi:6-pyruvoyltetrahydropterin/6-carboxytetrahydropterin synthase